MINLWAGGCYGCKEFSEVSLLRILARHWRQKHEMSGCTRGRIYRVMLAATK